MAITRTLLCDCMLSSAPLRQDGLWTSHPPVREKVVVNIQIGKDICVASREMESLKKKDPFPIRLRKGTVSRIRLSMVAKKLLAWRSEWVSKNVRQLIGRGTRGFQVVMGNPGMGRGVQAEGFWA